MGAHMIVPALNLNLPELAPVQIQKLFVEAFGTGCCEMRSHKGDRNWSFST